MDIIRDEYIAIGRIETGMPLRVYTQCGTHFSIGNYQSFHKKKSCVHIQKLIDTDLMQKMFEKYTHLMKNRPLRTEVKVCFERGYKLIRVNNAPPVRNDIERYSINFAVWSENDNRYDRGFGSTNNPTRISNLEKEFERLYKSAEEERRQEQLKSGFYNIILDPEATGLLAHEIVGHCMEADIWESNKEVRNLFSPNKKISNPDVSIYDDPDYPSAFGSYTYDDEGIKAKKVALISNGIVNDCMTSIATAHTQSAQSNGHARAITYKHQPIVRMSNTYFISGQTPVEQLFADMDNGLYLCGAGESRGGVSFTVKFPVCYAIENGKIRCRVSNAKLFGKIDQVLGNIIDVANDFKILGGGDGGCGKFDQWPMAVSAGGPHIRINSAFIMG